MNNNQGSEDVAVAGLVIALLVGSAFPQTTKWTTYLALFLLAGVWFSAYQNKSLPNTINVLGNQIHHPG